MSDAPLLWLGARDVAEAGGADIRAALAAMRRAESEMPAETSVRLGGPGEGQSRAYALPA